MTKKIYQLVLFCFSLCLPNLLIAENVETIIAKHIEAHGGLEKWNKVETMKITGQFTAFSIEKDFMAWKTRSGEYYADLQLGQHRVIEAFDGKKGWTIDPWQEISYARRINTGEENVFAQKAEFTTPFFNYKEKGHQVEFIGKEKLEGLDVFVLNLTRSNGKTEKWYLDANTYLETKYESKWVDFASEMPSETFFDDFRSVDGLLIPFFVERTFWQRDRVMQIENIEINPTFDNTWLIMPKREEIKKLAFLEGKWDVKMETWSRRGTWREIGQTDSNIDFTATNILQEKIKFELTFPIDVTISYTFNETTGKYRISLLDDYTSSFEVFEGDFSGQDFVFDNSVEKKETYIQFTISNKTDKGFILTKKISHDQGKTWQKSDKFTYTRSE
ncbi:hypothetical protein DWB61_11280 [Ancylomarina euxinus]|uniref:DUF1579 domain-containing protein n=1 Tax=Ancylomarina euxinus TaxID=2283627 RepID=A0A425XZV4_9BACT|nr:hypothetical protein [Ancylomarina euxinus]MCZ4695364.1 hypothetical protein [Ancylomarina euxinus]MUP15560.1 hypothetical protein [Ancylomarina euxinus]RRG20996.1 hypothetical protein DWB61_11280 [Ancylomarina euxinus]